MRTGMEKYRIRQMLLEQLKVPLFKLAQTIFRKNSKLRGIPKSFPL